ncbi:MAG: DUF1015 domain-containing protein [Deferribacteraceae bacterium]|nr:DUF1015 domain-containing protein [Deferribacteraceae bacterium]
MAIVRPFKGVRYNLEKVLLKQVIAPPYDVISNEYRANLVNRSAYNVVNIDLPIGEDRYVHAAQLYQSWLQDKVLIKEQTPSLYMYEQEYEYGGKSYIRTGFIGLLHLEDFGKGTVFPHEKTLAGPKKDRYDLMLECKANFSQIFGLYLDPTSQLNPIFDDCHEGMPIASAMDDDKVKHTIWPINDPESVNAIQNFMKDKAIYIADGHHRYETALMYRDTMRKKNNDDPAEAKPYDYVMMMFVNFYDPGLMVFPTHRAVDIPADFDMAGFKAKLSQTFSITPLAGLDAIDSFLAEHKDPGTIAMVTQDGIFGLLINQELLESLHPVYRNIDTYLLQKNIMESYLGIPEEQILAKKGIHFYQQPNEVKDFVDANSGIGFILKSVDVDTIRKVSESGLVMPQKSTYFYPKLATGLLINDI